MPQHSEPTEMTPFAQVLVNYMWNRRSPLQPPMGVAQLAHRLGLPRQNIYNWIHRGTAPTVEIILAVLARLDIPLRELYDAYQRAGLPVPPWDEHDTPPNVAADHDNPAISRSRKPATVPISEDTFPQQPWPSQSQPQPQQAQTPKPRPYVQQPAYDPVAERAAEWDRIIRQTVDTLREENVSEADIDNVVEYMRMRQAGIDPVQRLILAEHSEPAPSPADEHPQQRPQQKSQRKSPAKVNK